jgi:hypothetical protein
MAMNLWHRVFCSSHRYFKAVEDTLLPWARLHDTYRDCARIIRGDGTDTGLPSGEFSAVVCFAGSDSASSIPFRVLHFGDICNPVSPGDQPNRLRSAGFDDVAIESNGRRLRWCATKAG